MNHRPALPLSALKSSAVKAATEPLVLHARVITSTGGGPDKTILNSPRFLQTLGYRSTCAFFYPPGDDGFDVIRKRASQVQAELFEIPDRGKLDWRAIRAAARYCRDHDVQIWHAHDYKTNLIGLIARRFHPMKLITTAHGWVNFAGHTPRYYKLDKRWFLPRYERVICVSESVRQQCLRAGVPGDRCTLIENAIDVEQFRRRRSTESAKQQLLGISASRLLVGAIGRLADEKGFDLLINAFLRLLRSGLDLHLVIAGEGPEQDRLQTLIDESGASDRITLLGFCEATREFFESLDIFVLSSLREGLPNTLLEAMAVGVPTVATRVGGVARVVHDGDDGMLIDPGDEEQLTRAIRTLAEAPQLRSRYAQQATETIARDWSFAQRMQKIAGLYDELLGGDEEFANR